MDWNCEVMDEKIPTMVPSIDRLLEGGMEKGVITQIYGAAGTGKTNLLLQAAAQVLALGDWVVFIDTEGLSLTRMVQVFGEDYEDYLNRVHIYSPTSLPDQMKSVGELSRLARAKEIGMVDVDSINIYMRLEYGNVVSSPQDISRDFVKMLIQLQIIAREHGVPVLIASQVYGKGDEVLPFSGKSMEHIVKSIYQVKKTDIQGERELIVKKHRSIPSERRCRFRISTTGLE